MIPHRPANENTSSSGIFRKSAWPPQPEDHFRSTAPWQRGRAHPPQPGIVALLLLAWLCVLVAAFGLAFAAWERIGTPTPGLYLVSRP